MINALLRERGLSQTVLARRLKKKPAAVCGVIHGRIRSAEIAKAVAHAIRKPVGELWPTKYPAIELIELRPVRKGA